MADNLRHSQPLGIETNFGYDRDFKEKYRLWRLIPRDDYSGVVDAIELCSLGKTFDVKFISKREMIDEVAVKKVKREVDILKRLQSEIENVPIVHSTPPSKMTITSTL